MTTQAMADQIGVMGDRIIRDAVDAAAIAGRLDQYVSHAIRIAPVVATWWSGRLAVMRRG